MIAIKREADPQLAARLKQVRQARRMNQAEMAETLGMSLRTYKYAESAEKPTTHARALLLALKAIEAGLELEP